MGAIVGKIMPRPMGPYSPNAVYDILDIVTFNDSAWLCKQPGTMGVLPSADNSLYWMLLISSAVSNAATLDGYDSTYFAPQATVDAIVNGGTAVDNATKLAGYDSEHFATKVSVDAIIDGTTPVANAANAATLEGHEASYFASKTELAAATDANTLEGHPASYFATQEALATAIATTEGVIADVVDGAIPVANASALAGHEAEYFATQTAIEEVRVIASDATSITETKGQAGGLASLDDDGKITADQMSAAIINITEGRMLEMGDAGRLICVDCAADTVMTIPLDATVDFPIGTELEVCRMGEGAFTFTPETIETVTEVDGESVTTTETVTLNSVEGALGISAQYACAALKKIAANRWLISGSLG